NVSGTNSFAGPLTLGSNTAIAAAGGTQLNLTGTEALAGYGLTYGSSSANGTVNATGVISGTGSVTVASGKAILGNSANTFTGAIQVDSGATLQAGADGAFGASSNGITLSGGALQATSSFTIGSGRAMTLSGGGGTIDTQANNVAYNGVIA